jgi:hypothetical protein
VRSVWKIAAILLIVIGVVSLTLFLRGEGRPRLPTSQLPTIETGVLYTVAITRGSGVGIAGDEQDYRIRLSAGKMVMVETAVAWLDMRVMLYSNGLLLGESSCGYNARCHFFAEVPEDGWGILRVKWGSNGGQAPFSLEVRQVRNESSRGEPSAHTGVLPTHSIPTIDLDVIYKGMMSASDVPLFKSGGGGAQEYQLRLKAGQPVLVQARSAGFDIFVSVHGEDGRIAFDPRRTGFDASRACVRAEAPIDGLYTLRVTTRDNVRDFKAGDFTLEAFTIQSDEQSCYTDPKRSEEA